MDEKWKRNKNGSYFRGQYKITRAYHYDSLDADKHSSMTWEVYHEPTGEFIGDAYTLSNAKPIAENDEHKRLVAKNRKSPTSKRNALPIISERHFIGQVLLENLEHLKDIDLNQCDFGIQTHNDGRVWICLNGIAFLRFKPLITDPELVPMFPLKGNDD